MLLTDRHNAQFCGWLPSSSLGGPGIPENKCSLRFLSALLWSCSTLHPAHVSCVAVSCFDDIWLVIAESVGDRRGFDSPILSFGIFDFLDEPVKVSRRQNRQHNNEFPLPTATPAIINRSIARWKAIARNNDDNDNQQQQTTEAVATQHGTTATATTAAAMATSTAAKVAANKCNNTINIPKRTTAEQGGENRELGAGMGNTLKCKWVVIV